MISTGLISILLGFLALFAESSTQQLKPNHLRSKISRLRCKPIQAYGREPVTPCYDFSTKKLVPVGQCNLRKNNHCCMYNCACILKGAGHPRGIIPKYHKLPAAKLNFAERKAATPRFRKKGCKVKVPRKIIRTTSAPATSGSETTVWDRGIANTTTVSGTTPCPGQKKTSLIFFNRFAQVLRGFGFGATVERVKPC